MSWLRALLLLSLLVGGLFILLNVPYRAKTDLNGMPYTAAIPEEKPWFSDPPVGKIAHFEGRLSEWLDSRSITITVERDDFSLFKRSATIVVGIFFLYGLMGLFLDKHRPIGSDVAYSLAMTSGLIIGTILSGAAATWWKPGLDFAWLSFFWTGGLVIALIGTFLWRRRYDEPTVPPVAPTPPPVPQSQSAHSS